VTEREHNNVCYKYKASFEQEYLFVIVYKRKLDLTGQGRGGEDSLTRISVLFSFSMRASRDRFSQFQLRHSSDRSIK
jgi:hypothetical protein